MKREKVENIKKKYREERQEVTQRQVIIIIRRTKWKNYYKTYSGLSKEKIILTEENITKTQFKKKIK